MTVAVYVIEISGLLYLFFFLFFRLLYKQIYLIWKFVGIVLWQFGTEMANILNLYTNVYLISY